MLRKGFLLLHRAIGQLAVDQPVLLLVAVAVAGGQVEPGAVVVRVKTRPGGPGGVVVGNATGVAVRGAVTAAAHLEAVAVAGGAVSGAVAIGLATADRDGTGSAVEVKTVIGVAVAGAVREFVSRAGAVFGGKTIRVPARAVRVVIRDAARDGVVIGAGADDFNAGILISIGIAGRDLAIGTVTHDAMIRALDRQALEGDAVAWRKAVRRGPRGEDERGWPLYGHTARHFDRGGDAAVSAGHIDRGAGLRGLDGGNDGVVRLGYNGTCHEQSN